MFDQPQFEWAHRLTLNSEGGVYFLLAERTGLVKIGWTFSLNERIKQIGRDVKSRMRLLYFRNDNRCWKAERQFHRILEKYRVSGEWFRIDEYHIADACTALTSMPENGSKRKTA